MVKLCILVDGEIMHLHQVYFVFIVWKTSKDHLDRTDQCFLVSSDQGDSDCDISGSGRGIIMVRTNHASWTDSKKSEFDKNFIHQIPNKM